MSTSLVASEVTSKTCMSFEYSIGSCLGGVEEFSLDPRHQEILISELEQGVRGLSTLGVKNPQRKRRRWGWRSEFVE